MISRRTAALAGLALVCSVAMAWVLHRRLPLCAEARHRFARRAPIAGASEAGGLLCAAMYRDLPADDAVIAGAWVLSVAAVFRSGWIDVHTYRLRRRAHWLE